MKTRVLFTSLVVVLLAAPALGTSKSPDWIQAPRGQDAQALRGQDAQASRGQDAQAPRGQDAQAPRGEGAQAL